MNILTSIIGNNQDSNPENIKKVRKKLHILGIESGDEDRGYIDQDLDTAIRGFQRGMNLKEDGIMKPNGETETRLNHVLQLVSEGEITPPLPAQKPFQTTPPLPGRKEDAIIKKYAKEKADVTGDLAGELVTRGISRIPLKRKSRKILKETTKRGKDFISDGVSNIFDGYYEYMDRKKLKKNQE